MVRQALCRSVRAPFSCALIAPRDKFGDAANKICVIEQGHMALVGHFDGLHPRMARRHGGESLRRQNVGIGAADDQHGHARQRIEFVPQWRQPLFKIDGRKRARQLTS